MCIRDSFNGMPEDRQKAMREEIDALRRLPPDVRQERMSSPDFVEKFDQHERRVIRDMEKAFHEPDGEAEDEL